MDAKQAQQLTKPCKHTPNKKLKQHRMEVNTQAPLTLAQIIALTTKLLAKGPISWVDVVRAVEAEHKIF